MKGFIAASLSGADVAFTPDARRVLVAYAGGGVRVWDVPTGRCVDWLAFGAPCVSLAVFSLRKQNQLLAGHPNAYVYNALGSLLDVDGHFLESEPLHASNQPELPSQQAKLDALKRTFREPRATADLDKKDCRLS